MPRKSDEIIKGFIGQIGTMIDARSRTLEINIKGHVDKAIKDSEARIRRDMATKDDIKNMATKDDIKNMATKDDIKNMATKDDIKNMATKDDIKNMATKDDIKNMATKDDINRLEQKIDKTSELQRQLEELKERVKAVEEDIRVHN